MENNQSTETSQYCLDFGVSLVNESVDGQLQLNNPTDISIDFVIESDRSAMEETQNEETSPVFTFVPNSGIISPGKSVSARVASTFFVDSNSYKICNFF